MTAYEQFTELRMKLIDLFLLIVDEFGIIKILNRVTEKEQ